MAYYVPSIRAFMIFVHALKKTKQNIDYFETTFISSYVIQINTTTCPPQHKSNSSIKQVVRRLQLVFYRSFLPQRRAFCSHHEIPPRRPQTSISVFP